MTEKKSDLEIGKVNDTYIFADKFYDEGVQKGREA